MPPGRVRDCLSSYLIHFVLNYLEIRSLMGVKSLERIFPPLKIARLKPRKAHTSVWRQEKRHSMRKFTGSGGFQGLWAQWHGHRMWQLPERVKNCHLHKCLGESVCINRKNHCIKVFICGPNTIIWGLFWLSLRASLTAQLVKNLPAMQETLVQFLGRDDLLEKA